ncbi:MAG: TRAP transporter small permease subunit [Deltaproteobacteria bacterium]|nr:TRAP transporter small permease subunit [Deltaproteobacteria bacterium]
MDSLKTVVHTINRICAFLGGIFIIILTTIAAGNMLLRIIYRPIHGSYELIGFFGAASIGLALGYTQLRKDHIIVTIVSDRFGKKTKKIIDLFSNMVSSLFFIVCGTETLKWGSRLAKSGELSETLKIPYYPFVYLLGTGFLIIAITLILDFIIAFERKK